MGDITIRLSGDFGGVVFDVILSWIILFWMALRVSMARRKYNVKYPALYSDTSQEFNCIQRAHQNTLEKYPEWLISLVLGGFQHPGLCSVAGFLWLVSRVVYAHGYYTGDPSKRVRGSFGYLGMFVQMGCTVSLALHLIG